MKGLDVGQLQGSDLPDAKQRLYVAINPALIHRPGGVLYPPLRTLLILVTEFANRQGGPLGAFVRAGVNAPMHVRQLLAGFVASLVRRQRPYLSNSVLPEPVVAIAVHDDPRHRAGPAYPQPKTLQGVIPKSLVVLVRIWHQGVDKTLG